ncbi:MAG: hypothetical protein EON95_18860, partial [Caulobacteraceae bacterium]
MAYRIGAEGLGEIDLLAGFGDYGDDATAATPETTDTALLTRAWLGDGARYTAVGHMDALGDLSIGASAADGPDLYCGCPACSGGGERDKDLSIPNGGGVGDDDPSGFLNAAQRGGTGPNGKPSKTIEEAAFHLNRTYASWNDFFTQPGVSDVDNNWDDAYWGGATSIVSYGFRGSGQGVMPSGTTGFVRFNEAQINATIQALASWSDVANVVFVRTGTGTIGEAAYTNDPNTTMLFSAFTGGAEGSAAFAYLPSQSAAAGDVWVKNSGTGANPQLGNYGMLTLVHEIGHAIGFSHPGAYNADPDIEFVYSTSAEYYEDSHQYTVMSYFTEGNTGGNFGPTAYPGTVMLDDIAAAQRTYGVNTTTRTGDTVYGFNSNAGRAWFSATSASTILVFAVWDAGGNDTFDFSGFTNNQVIDLREGNFSNVGTANGASLVGNVAIAKGAVIENAIGGIGNDTIIGNAAANHITGGAGGDTLTGGAGADVFHFAGAAGADTITDFLVGTDLIDDTAYGQYQSVVQSGGDTLVTLSSGVTVR